MEVCENVRSLNNTYSIPLLIRESVKLGHAARPRASKVFNLPDYILIIENFQLE